MSLKRRISLLEKRCRVQASYPPVVVQEEGQSVEEAISAMGISPPPGHTWQYVVVPATLSEEDWIEKYSPKDLG